jgi:hypothetical protein
MHNHHCEQAKSATGSLVVHQITTLTPQMLISTLKVIACRQVGLRKQDVFSADAMQQQHDRLENHQPHEGIPEFDAQGLVARILKPFIASFFGQRAFRFLGYYRKSHRRSPLRIHIHADCSLGI